jgi:hypothetical protein
MMPVGIWQKGQHPVNATAIFGKSAPSGGTNRLGELP